MCRILFKPTNQTKFDRVVLEESYVLNSDGTGLIYFNEKTKKLEIHKWLRGTPFRTIYRQIKNVEKNINAKNICVHFRFATSGKTNFEQTHPVRVNSKMWIIHNGVCPNFVLEPKCMSDTQVMGFWMSCLKKDIESFCSDGWKNFLEEKFHGNKVIVFEKNKYLILNEYLGEWQPNGIWYSWKKNYNLYNFDCNNDSKWTPESISLFEEENPGFFLESEQSKKLSQQNDD